MCLSSSLLSLYPDQQLATYVVAGVRAGFLIGLSGDICVRSSFRNHPSCCNMPSVVGGILLQSKQLVGFLALGHALLACIPAMWAWSLRIMMVWLGE